jgi:predicted small metal-binding protein
MSKVIHCSKVNPSSDCDHVIRGETEQEVLQKAGVHAKEHGLEPTPELIEKVRAAIEDE